MSTKTITIRICDSCGKEIKGRLIVHTCPCCGKDICVACQEAQDAKDKTPDAPKKLKKKEFVPPVSESDTETTENVSISTPVTPGGQYRVTIHNSEAYGDTLKETVLEALKPWDGKIPTELLTNAEVKILQGILGEES